MSRRLPCQCRVAARDHLGDSECTVLFTQARAGDMISPIVISTQKSWISKNTMNVSRPSAQDLGSYLFRELK